MSCEYCYDHEEAIFEDDETIVYVTGQELRNHKQVYTGASNGNTERIKIDYQINFCPMCGEPLTEPKALTLGEMAQMDGKPVWIVTEYDDIITGLISLTGNCFAKEPSITLKNGNFLLLEDMGACKAYTHKPKE